VQHQTIITVDARGMRCPLPVLRLAKAMREHPAAAVFDLVADDPAAARDVPAFAEERGAACAVTGPLQWRLTRPSVSAVFTDSA
jgi:tRNA 2-thiouridine synthesizing protein A